MADQEGDAVEITEQVKVKCFCGLWLVAGHSGPEKEPCLLHPMPACKRYLNTEPAALCGGTGVLPPKPDGIVE